MLCIVVDIKIKILKQMTTIVFIKKKTKWQLTLFNKRCGLLVAWLTLVMFDMVALCYILRVAKQA
jgi:hypothetical protein